MITIGIPEVQLVNTNNDRSVVMDEGVAGAISQHLANAVVEALKNGAGFSIREDSVEITVTTRRSVETDVAETYVGR